ncbi:MAG: T9SS type A sorting domain-containing protein [Flavobacteriales bacterium]
MKNILQLGLFMFLVSGMFAQDLQTSNADTSVSGVSGTAAADELEAHIDVINASNDSVEVECVRQIISQDAPGAEERFCWAGLCFEQGTEVSPLTLDMLPGETAFSVSPDSANPVGTGLTGYYNYNGENGGMEIEYCFREVGNPDNQTCITVKFCVSSLSFCDTYLGTNEIIDETVLGQASPNPASENFLVSYKLGSEAVDAQMIIINAIGEEVRNVQLANRTGVVNFDATDLQTGMYFYTIKNNGKTEGTKKFIVSH